MCKKMPTRKVSPKRADKQNFARVMYTKRIAPYVASIPILTVTIMPSVSIPFVTDLLDVVYNAR
jgi:hypothetical protein